MENEILALPAECWRWYPSFEGIAQVSTSGDVKTVDRWVTDKNGRKWFVKGRILKPGRGKNGYLFINLYRNGKQHHFYVHRMVLEVWGDGNPENKPEVNHRDEDKTNNSVENLSYCDHKENMAWGTARKRQAASQSIPVQAINPSTGEVVREFASAREAGRNGFNQGHVSACCRGEERQHKGYKWRYKP